MMVDGWNFLHKFLHHLVIVSAGDLFGMVKWPDKNDLPTMEDQNGHVESPGIWEKSCTINREETFCL